MFGEVADPSGRAKTFHSCGRLTRTEVKMLERTPASLRRHAAAMQASAEATKRLGKARRRGSVGFGE